MSEKNNLSTFITRANLVHNYKYDYSSVEYRNVTTKIKIICPIHGIFEQIPYNHLKGFGCIKCGYNLITDNDIQFIEKATKIHNNKYDYYLVNYVGSRVKVDIICNRCKEVFSQTPNSHLTGHGCINCRGTATFTRTGWIKLCDSQNKTPLLYIIRCYIHDEEFIKIGRTSRSIHERFWSGMPYSYEVLKEIKGSPDFIFDKESELHRKYKKYKYSPKIPFCGKTECSNISILQDILKQ